MYLHWEILRSKVFYDLLCDLVRNDTICCCVSIHEISFSTLYTLARDEINDSHDKNIYILQRLDVRGLYTSLAKEVHILL